MPRFHGTYRLAGSQRLVTMFETPATLIATAAAWRAGIRGRPDDSIASRIYVRLEEDIEHTHLLSSSVDVRGALIR
jgi:hypothetical protein